MKILLLKPSWPYPYTKNEYTYNRIWPPLELANCAAILEKNGFEAAITDAHALRLSLKDLGRCAKSFDKIFVTSSSRDRWQCPNLDISPFINATNQLTNIAKEVYVMGYHGTVAPHDILKATNAKAVIRGEPEKTVLDICSRRNLSEVKGVSFLKDGVLVSTSERELLDLAEVPIPAFHLLNFKLYFHEILGRNLSLFEINRGCHFRCAFCNKVMYGDGVRSKSLEQIQLEIEKAVECYGVKTGCFIDLDFLAKRETAIRLCEFLMRKRYKFTWTCSTRADLLDRDILSAMKDAGCRLIKMGVESGNENQLNTVNKSLNLKVINSAFQLCRSIGIKTLAFFIFGFPSEGRADREKTLTFSKNLNSDFVSFHKLIFYKGSLLPDDRGKDSTEGIEKFIRKAYVSYYFRISYLFKVSFSTYWMCFKLFLGRIFSLK